MKQRLKEKIAAMDAFSEEEKAYLFRCLQEEYGFHFEAHIEAAQYDVQDHTPVLIPIPEKHILCGGDVPRHILIEGENLHSLEALRAQYTEKIDLIYIDPPYNRGLNDLVYTDNYIDKSAGNRHNIWLSFMDMRLRIAKDLLHSEGVLFVSIDNHELAPLKLLLDDIFGEDNCIEIFSWVKTKTPSNLSQKTKEMVEYILCYQKQPNKIRFRGIQKSSSSDNPLLKPNAIEKELVFPPNSMSIKINDECIPVGIYGTSTNPVQLLTSLDINNGSNRQEVRVRGRFVWTQDKLISELEKGTVVSIKTNSLILSYEKTSYAPEVPPNLIDERVGVGTNEHAKTELKALDLHGFDYPKPLSLLQYLLQFLPKKKLMVLDFFAGSGTTTHAAIRLNEEKGYEISSILCTNNQNDIAQEITYPRLKRVIQGYTSKEGKQTKPHAQNELLFYQCTLKPNPQ